MYEGFLALTAATILAYRFLHERRFRGQMVLEYLIAYSVVRFIAEFFRMEPPSLWGLHAAQIVSVVVVLTASVIYALLLRFGRTLFVDGARQTQ